MSFHHPAAERTTLAVQHGAVGVDFNVDHLAVTETDLYGNMVRTQGLPLLREDAASGQRGAVLSDALSTAVRLAKEARKPLVVEDLDFSAKKKALGQVTPKGARMLSGLLYAKYRQQLEAKCFRAGVELIQINPAYTSTIGAVKYAARRGWSVHAAAAGVIARRGQKLRERLPRAGTDALKDEGEDKPRERTVKREAYFVEFTGAVRAIAKMPVMVVGGFRSTAAMIESLERGELDIVGLGRPLIADPETPKRILSGEIERAVAPEATLNLFHLLPWNKMQLVRLGEGLDPELSLDGADAAAHFEVAEKRILTDLLENRKAA